MAKLTLLSIVQAACSEMGLPAPISIASTQDLMAVQMLALANREAKECMRRENASGGWQAMRKENVFQVQSSGLVPGCTFTLNSNIITIGTPATQAPQVGWVLSSSGGSNATGFPYPTSVVSVVGSTVTVSNKATISNTNTAMAFGQEAYALPNDYDYLLDDTTWDRGNRWKIFGPLSPQEWQVLKSGLSPTGPRRRFRIMLGKFYLDPIPFDSNTLVYEYHSTSFALDVTNVPKTQFSVDTDTYVLPDDLLILGLIWRWRRSKGLDYTQEAKIYEDAVSRELARDAGTRVLQLNASLTDYPFITSNQIPDTGFGR